MGDLADDFRRVRRGKDRECTACEGSGIEVVEDEKSESGESLIDCSVCGGDGIKPGHPSKDN